MTSFLSPCFFGYSAKTTKTGFCAGWLEIMFCFSLVRNVQIPLWIMHDKSNSWLSKTCGRRGGKQVERGDQETGNQSRWWGGLRAYSSHNKRRKRESDNKKSERLGQIGAYSSPEKGIVIEGLVPMAIAPSMNVFVGICVCVCGWAVTGPWDHKERLAKAVVNHIDAMGLETAEILG